jgi:hypothetical protein
VGWAGVHPFHLRHLRKAAERILAETSGGAEPEPSRVQKLASTLWAALLAFANTAAACTFAEGLRDTLLPLLSICA